MPLASVILPTCDRPALLARAVASVQAQTEADFELLVIDHNRGERPVAESPAAAAWQRDPRVRIIRPAAGRSAAAARNAGLAAARGEWVSYLDDDDAWQPGKLARQLDRARRTGAPLVLCGATFHLPGRQRRVQCYAPSFRGDDVLLQARWNTPLLLHRREGSGAFDESLQAGEDAVFAHRLLARAGAAEVPNVAEALVDIYPQAGPRVNRNAAPVRPAAARILAARPGAYSRGARRRYVLRVLLTVAKLEGRPLRCAGLAWRLWRESGGADWRVGANAVAVSAGFFPSRWVS